NEEVEQVGEANTVEQVERSIKLPAEVCLKANDALNEAIVTLSFGAEPGKEVPMTHLNDAPDRVGSEGQKPEFDSESDGEAA
ncbi:hypothetical protein, partial [Halomarina oriensis]